MFRYRNLEGSPKEIVQKLKNCQFVELELEPEFILPSLQLLQQMTIEKYVRTAGCDWRDYNFG